MRKLRHFYQRARRGYSDQDLWSLDAYIASILADACPRLHTADEEWNRDMDEMARLFGRYAPWDFDRDEETEAAVALLAKNFRGLWT